MVITSFPTAFFNTHDVANFARINKLLINYNIIAGITTMIDIDYAINTIDVILLLFIWR